MVSKKLRGMLVAAAAGTMMVSMTAMAQAPGGGPPGGGPPRGGGMGGGFAQPTDAAGVMQRFGLSSPEMKLSDAQKASIEKLANAYLEDMKKVPPMTQGQPPSQEAMTARQAARTKFNTEVEKVLNADQKKLFQAAQQQRGGGGGPPGGGGFGGGGFGGGRPGGGGPGGPPPGGA